ncbi:LOW QUALITY PROTEIN: hypothetical protein JCM24511_04279 [Saitozyma sp. JCM 24511]|nr:LOW QUALITY PROTEIN: hypothetical protein JCM24511_04279 [Saitozyma sp. JCM 24511]
MSSLPQYYTILVSCLITLHRTPRLVLTQLSERGPHSNGHLVISLTWYGHSWLTRLRDEVRAAYKRESLKTHPDRLPGNATPQERRRATERFQAVADAYYVLSDPARRAEYDSLFRSRPASAFTDETASEFEQEQASGSFFQNFSNFFQNTTGAGAGPAPTETHARPDPNGVFGDVFEEMLAPEVAHVRPWWSWVGGGAGATLGYIIANVPGAVAGVIDAGSDASGFAGNRLGAVRDAKGKSVAQVFAGMETSKKAEILRALAFKVLGSMS